MHTLYLSTTQFHQFSLGVWLNVIENVHYFVFEEK